MRTLPYLLALLILTLTLVATVSAQRGGGGSSSGGGGGGGGGSSSSAASDDSSSSYRNAASVTSESLGTGFGVFGGLLLLSIGICYRYGFESFMRLFCAPVACISHLCGVSYFSIIVCCRVPSKACAASLRHKRRHDHELSAQLAPAPHPTCFLCGQSRVRSVACTKAGCGYVECLACYLIRIDPLRGSRVTCSRGAAALNAAAAAAGTAVVRELKPPISSSYEYKARYRCDVTRITFTSEGVLLDFSAVCVGLPTLGPLQDPDGSTLMLSVPCLDGIHVCAGPRVSFEADVPYALSGSHITGKMAFALSAATAQAALASHGDAMEVVFRYGEKRPDGSYNKVSLGGLRELMLPPPPPLVSPFVGVCTS
jgi:hypothetical protein